MRKMGLLFWGFFLCFLSYGQAGLKIRAFIDGRDQIIISGSTVQWLHFDNSAPGRLSFQNLPTYINDVAWYPYWPNIPDAENRQKCFSSSFSNLSPALPLLAQNYLLNKIQVRENISIIQQPNDTNKFTLIIEFNDNITHGAEWYNVSIDLTTNVINVHDISLLEKFKIYPNPTNGVFEILINEFNGSDYKIVIANSTGSIIKTELMQKNSVQLDLSKYSAGLYYIKLITNKEIYQFKLIKE